MFEVETFADKPSRSLEDIELGFRSMLLKITMSESLLSPNPPSMSTIVIAALTL
jgi:hypothetical protein